MSVIEAWEGDEVVVHMGHEGDLLLKISPRAEREAITWLTRDQAGELAAVLLRFKEKGEVE